MFVTLEGPEGAGKSTAIAGIAEVLRAGGKTVTVTREPGAGEIGKGIRRLLLEPSEAPMSARCELFLFLADRAQHVATVIKPALAKGEVVLCDRFGDSTVVYQGHARGLDIATLKGLNRFATEGLAPDLTLLLDIDPEIGLTRVRDKDRLDAESLEFHQAVREGFLHEAKAEPSRWHIVDAAESPDLVVTACVLAIQGRLA